MSALCLSTDHEDQREDSSAQTMADCRATGGAIGVSSRGAVLLDRLMGSEECSDRHG